MRAEGTNLRGRAWELGLQGQYDAAVDILDTVLEKVPRDIESLRMKGNLLELKAMDLLEHSARKLTSSQDYLAARRCYEKILDLDPRNVTAHIDLGDHYKNLGAKDKALDYYKLAADDLKQEGPGRPVWKQNLQELRDRVSELGENHSRAAEVAAIRDWCAQSLGVPEPSER